LVLGSLPWGKSTKAKKTERKSFAGWLGNDKIIQNFNGQQLSFKLGHNEYSDMTGTEFAQRFTMQMPPSMVRVNNDTVDWTLADPKVFSQAPDSIDWVDKGAVTGVKNQEHCGSCWAFSTTGSLEGAFAIGGYPLTSFSEQQLVSCDTAVDNGCHGGLMDNAFRYVEAHGLCTEESYPYTSGTGDVAPCKKCKVVDSKTGVKITGFTDVPSMDEDALKAAAANGPVSVAVEADKSVFQLYKEGVMDSPLCGTKLDHGVLVVGYGTEGGKDYWKVKNSWGPSWGDSGYILLGRGTNVCGVSAQPSYPTGAKPFTPHGPSPGPSPPSPSPGPSPPSPSPSPGPSPVNCFDIKTKAKCETHPSSCKWCQYNGYGICDVKSVPCP